jgi:peroxiredoxin
MTTKNRDRGTRMSDVKEGDPAPAFELPADGGGRISSASLEGKIP